MTISYYRCFRCLQQVTEEHEGARVKPEQKILCKQCCREAFGRVFEVETKSNEETK